MTAGREFLDPGLDFETDAFTSAEKESMLAWYRDVHDYGDLDLAPFARFAIEHDPGGFKRLRRHVMTLDEPADGVSLPTVVGVLMYVHAYTAMGNGKGALYEVIAVRALGVTKPQVLETIRLATLYGGPLGLNPLGELAMDYLAEWTDDPGEPVSWPDGWVPDVSVFRSGIDPGTDELLPGELELVEDWYRRTYGEAPPHVESFARLHPKAFKTQQLRFELAPTGALPAQVVPLLRLHLGAIRQSPSLMRRATQMARTLGVRRHHVVSTLFWAAVYGGETILEAAHAAVADVLETMQ
jgi:hypothetical protein